MTRIRKFVKGSGTGVREHPTEVDCGFSIISIGGKRYLQLNTYGSAHRKIPGKMSQTLQLDARAARQLRSLLDEAFG